LDYLKCGVSIGEVLTDPLTKKQSLITTIKKFFCNIPQGGHQDGLQRFQPRLEKVVAVKGDFIC
jgi:hypothetical protein